jgi:hypothetical protein
MSPLAFSGTQTTFKTQASGMKRTVPNGYPKRSDDRPIDPEVAAFHDPNWRRVSMIAVCGPRTALSAVDGPKTAIKKPKAGRATQSPTLGGSPR